MINCKPCDAAKIAVICLLRTLAVLLALFFCFSPGFAQAPNISVKAVITPTVAAPNISYQTPQTYTVNTAIAPLAPTNTGGAVPATIYGQVSTFAGSGAPGPANGTGTAASFNTPYGLTVDASYNIYVADYNNQQIRKITQAGVVSTFAGSGAIGATNGTGATASFNYPGGVTTDALGNVYVGDQTNNLVRMITPAGLVSTFAGNGLAGSTNGALTSSSFYGPAGMSFDNAGNLFVADRNSSLIRKITPAGIVSTFAGNGSTGAANGTGTAASFYNASGTTTDQAGNVYVVDQNNSLIRKITPAGVVSTFAGNGTQGKTNGAALAASFYRPFGLTVDFGGTVYVADEFNNLIRTITVAGAVATLAGSGVQGSVDGIGTAASFNYPAGVALDGLGNLFVADAVGNKIRKVIVTGYTIDKALPAGLTFDPTTGIISGTPTAVSPATNYTVTAYNTGGSSAAVVNIAVVAAVVPVIPAVLPPNISYQTPQIYVINTAIASLAPANTGGAVPATVYGQVSTLASGFNTVTGVATDAAGNIYVDDWGNNLIKKVTPAGAVTIFAGNGSSGAVNGQGAAASFNEPDGLAADAAGNMYIGDEDNNLVRKITPGGLVTTLAGSGAFGTTNGTGAVATFNYPRGLAVDASGNVYLADQGNNEVRMITQAGVVGTYAGTVNPGFANGAAANATFNTPTGVGLDGTGNLYVADAGNNAIRKITPAGVVSTFATGFNFPREVRVDGTGNFYVSDQNSNTVKRITPGGVVSTLAGTGQTGATNGAATVATFSSPIGLVLDGLGNLYLGDSGNSLVRKIIISGYTIDKTLPAGLSFNPTTGIISGTPTVVSPATDYTVTAYNGGGSSSTIVNITVELPAPLKPSIITFPPPPANSADANNNVTPGATSTNNETPIIYTSSDTTVAIITAGGLIHLVGPGVTTITATQSGDANYTAAIPVPETMNVFEYEQISFPAIAAKLPCSADFSVNTSSYSTAYPITYTSSDTTVATISSKGIVHIVGTGSTVITANQAGGGFYIAAQPESQTLTVNVPVVPLVTIAPDHASVCVGTPVTFTATVSNLNANITYQWQVNGINAGTNSVTFVAAAPLPTDVFICLVTNTAACQTIGTSNSYTGIVISQYVTPTVSITTSATGPVCAGTSITFTATATNGGASPGYQWQINGVNAGTSSSTFTSANLADGDLVTCLLTNNGGACLTAATATSNTVKVMVVNIPNPAPSVTISASANDVYPGIPITFTAMPVNAGTVTAYLWRVNGSVVGNNATYTSSTLKNGDQVTCTITSSLTCTIPAISPELLVNILPQLSIKIPNTFTPNGDGINDTWNIPDLFSYPNCFISIFSRYGALLYQSRGYSKGWDGFYNGQPLPFSTYYYIIDLGNNSPKLSGHVTIVK